MPAFAVVLLWQFTSIWNDYLIGLVVLSTPRLAPINVAVVNIAGSWAVEWNVQMAAALIAALPTILSICFWVSCSCVAYWPGR